MAEIGEDEGILGNNFAMAYEITVHEAQAVLTGKLGYLISWVVRVITGVRAVLEETLAVRTTERITIFP